ncbi:hypothetical protein DITRI_Ditri14bG0043400 [Diplodiscus trichospermus]
MSDNSVDWASVIGAISDSDELMSIIINDVKAENLGYGQLQESSKILLQPAGLPDQNFHVVRDVEPGSPSCLNQNLQNRMITTGGCLMNPLGFPYRSQKLVPTAAPSGSGIQSSQKLIIMNDIPVNKRGRNTIQEATEEAEQKKKMNKIKNRISAAKSRAKTQEHTKFLEEKVQQLRNENAHLKKLLSLEDAAKERIPEISIGWFVEELYEFLQKSLYRRENRLKRKGQANV